LLGGICLPLAAEAQNGYLPDDTQPAAGQIIVLCTVTAQGSSKDCRFEEAITNPTQRLKAGTELGFLDAHPFAISGATPGTDVAVCVRLVVRASYVHPGFDVTGPDEMFRPASGPPITDPIWSVSPHDSWTSPFIPDIAVRRHQGGSATVRCTATLAGGLVNCWVQQESPANFGFGAAAMLILQHARMASLSASGQSVAGRPYIQTFAYGADGTWTP
jgi:hypothetical protein